MQAVSESVLIKFTKARLFLYSYFIPLSEQDE
jgi:hypothetical protein